MSKVGCKIVKTIKRPPRELIEAFRKIPVANIDDCLNRMSAIDESIRPMNNSRLLGPAFTIKVPEGDNLMLHKAMDMIQPGDVIVIDGGGMTKRALFGELMVSYCKIRGAAGIIVDGSIRDSDFIRNLEDFSVYARGVTPNGPYRNGPGEIGTSVVVGGRIVNPGDIVAGDGDGVLFISPVEAEDTLDKVYKIQEMENKIIKVMKEEKKYIRSWVDEKLEELGCEYVE